MTELPKVSVITITYNHEKYIRQALDGFVAQQTNFSFEVIIADDCSTDKTADIIREYARVYPDIFKPILRKKNIGAQDNFRDAIQRAIGQYIALCEGDDFWTDEHKLQRQVDFLDKNDDYSLCFHPVSIIYDNNEQPDAIFPVEKDGFTLKKLLKSNYIQTNSVMYRRRNYDNIPLDILPMDWYLHLFHAQFGKIGFIDQNMSSYRRHSGGMWWGSNSSDLSFWEKYAQLHINLFEEIKKLFTDRSDSIKSEIISSEITLLLSIIKACQQEEKGKIFLEILVSNNPAAFLDLSLILQNELEKALNLVQENRDINQQLTQEIELKNEDILKAKQELGSIQNSLSWRITKPLRIIRNRL